MKNIYIYIHEMGFHLICFPFLVFNFSFHSLCFFFGIILQQPDFAVLMQKIYFFFFASFARNFSSRRRCRSVSDRYNLYPKNANKNERKRNIINNTNI